MYDQGMKFLSTPSGWKATEHVAPETGRRIISIHALRVEGDWLRTGAGEMFKPHFYPRPPGGRRPFCTLWACRTSIFLSTPSGWKATPKCPPPSHFGMVFLSTPSGWKATYHLFSDCPLIRISIHALRVEGDGILSQGSAIVGISIHALRVEGDKPGRWSSTTR